jgi:hypothetical protein
MLFSALGWVVLLGVALLYVRHVKHRDRTLVSAFGIFVGIFGGITMAAITVVVGVIYALGLEGRGGLPPSVGAMVAIIVIIPAWRMAVNTIRRPSPE